MLTNSFSTYIICTVMIKDNAIEFEWDNGNLDKSYLKHGITPKEAEEAFVNDNSYVFSDVKHSQKEKRFIVLGKTEDDRSLFVVFTIRKNKIRIISARRMHGKEVEKYEKAKKNTKI